MTDLHQRKKWLHRVCEDLRTRGYHYEPTFSEDTSNSKSLITAAKLLGHLYVPSDLESTQPFIHTRPSSSAPPWRPFDRAKPIRWHNDFSTYTARPELSLSWILREDPKGPDHGAWWVASSTAVLTKLSETPDGKRLVDELTTRAQPFGYRDSGSWRPFRVINAAHRSRYGKLRFYGPALEEGALLRFGEVPDLTKEIVSRIEEAANAVRVTLPARTGSLLIVHNGLSLHDRSPQTITGPEGLRRQALLCFVKKLHIM
ncbi:MAG TPA: TauD/TfdA family dioxygenase [Pyrinomonadaceae bacterium]|nr:TauD/TfdA family dioxygenase [Pyrinomonadaceae bacterium]